MSDRILLRVESSKQKSSSLSGKPTFHFAKSPPSARVTLLSLKIPIKTVEVLRSWDTRRCVPTVIVSTCQCKIG